MKTHLLLAPHCIEQPFDFLTVDMLTDRVLDAVTPNGRASGMIDHTRTPACITIHIDAEVSE